MKTFFWIWLGQSVSFIGTGLTGFAMGVWVFEETGSVTGFALVVMMTMLPGALLSPLLGVLIDRWGRRKAMILGDLGAGLRTIFLIVLLSMDNLQVWHIYLAASLRSICEAIQFPAYAAAIPLLIPRKQLGRANGMVQFGGSGAQIIAPAAAGLLMPVIGMEGVLLIDVVTFVFSIGILALLRIPRPPSTEEHSRASLWRQAAVGWQYIQTRPGLLSLMGFVALLNFLVGSSFVLMTPLVLSFGSATDLGFVLSAGSIGSLLGSLAMSAWGGTEKRIYGVLGFCPLLGIGLMVAGWQPAAPLIAAGVAILFFSFPVISASSQAIWQSKVEAGVQGRVFATKRMVQQITSPVAFLLSGWTADRFFIPLLSADGWLSQWLGPVFGTGSGRGIGLQFAFMGLLLLLTTAGGLLYPRLRNIDEDLPDVPIAAESA